MTEYSLQNYGKGKVVCLEFYNLLRSISVILASENWQDGYKNEIIQRPKVTTLVRIEHKRVHVID